MNDNIGIIVSLFYSNDHWRLWKHSLYDLICLPGCVGDACDEDNCIGLSILMLMKVANDVQAINLFLDCIIFSLILFLVLCISFPRTN